VSAPPHNPKGEGLPRELPNSKTNFKEENDEHY
jgi:hypothetical protein